MVMHSCNLSYSRSRGRRITSVRPLQEKGTIVVPILEDDVFSLYTGASCLTRPRDKKEGKRQEGWSLAPTGKSICLEKANGKL
jgi:hypothetical protein